MAPTTDMCRKQNRCLRRCNGGQLQRTIMLTNACSALLTCASASAARRRWVASPPARSWPAHRCPGSRDSSKPSRAANVCTRQSSQPCAPISRLCRQLNHCEHLSSSRLHRHDGNSCRSSTVCMVMTPGKLRWRPAAGQQCPTALHAEAPAAGTPLSGWAALQYGRHWLGGHLSGGQSVGTAARGAAPAAAVDGFRGRQLPKTNVRSTRTSASMEHRHEAPST